MTRLLTATPRTGKMSTALSSVSIAEQINWESINNKPTTIDQYGIDDTEGAYLNIDCSGDTLIAFGEIKTITVIVLNWLRQNITSSVTNWSVKRTTSDTDADDVWNLNHADFAGTMTITTDDLDDEGNTTFTIIADNIADTLVI